MAKLSPQQVKLTELAGEKIQTVLTHAPGNGAPIGGLKVVAESGWFAARPSGTENIYKIYAESFRGADHLRRILEEAQTIVAALARSTARRRRRSGSDRKPPNDGATRGIMSKQTRVSHPIYNLLPTEIEGFDSLAELALDMRWSWNHATDEVWRQLDPVLWELTQNPWVVLQTVSRDQLERVLADPAFRKNVDDLLRAKRQAAEAPAWFQQNHPQAPLTCVAYFSMEFMLSEALPIYSGGLGNVAGDQLKAASDLGVPVVGVGLLYQQGYFRQVIDKDGAQQALYPYNDPGQLPITPLRHPNGEWLRLEIALPGYSVWLRAWQVQVGRVKLYLLDSNDAANFPRSSRDHQRAVWGRAGVAPQARTAARDWRLAVARRARHQAGSLSPE